MLHAGQRHGIVVGRQFYSRSAINTFFASNNSRVGDPAVVVTKAAKECECRCHKGAAIVHVVPRCDRPVPIVRTPQTPHKPERKVRPFGCGTFRRKRSFERARARLRSFGGRMALAPRPYTDPSICADNDAIVRDAVSLRFVEPATRLELVTC